MLKPGDVVEVRSAAEILETLDTDGALNGMPFMPEMTRFAGKRFTVDRRAEKICDTVSGEPPNSRRLRDSVLLEDLRCDGSGHDGCQAGCRIYWKEAWLRRVDSAEARDHGGRGRRRRWTSSSSWRVPARGRCVRTALRCTAARRPRRCGRASA